MNAATSPHAPHTGHLAALVVSVLGLVTLLPASISTQAAVNAIVTENQQPGSNAWMWVKVGDDVNQQIKGYASATSVNQNENITFYVSVNPAQDYTIDFFRFGWYGGAGGRLRRHVGPLAGAQQSPCTVQDLNTGVDRVRLDCLLHPHGPGGLDERRLHRAPHQRSGIPELRHVRREGRPPGAVLVPAEHQHGPGVQRLSK